MKRLLSLLLIASMLVSCSASGSTAVPTDFVGKRAPNVRFTMLDGSAIALDSVKNKALAVIFWTTWCHYSQPEIEKFSELARELKGNKNIAFLAVSLDRASSLEKLKQKISSSRYTHFHHAFSGNEGADEAAVMLRVQYMPAVFLIDRNKNVVVATNDVDDVREALGR